MAESKTPFWRSFRPLWLGLAMLPLALSPLEAQDWRTLTTRRQLSGERELEVEIEFGAGTLSVEAGHERELFNASLRYDADNFEPISSYDAGRLHLGIEGTARGRRVARSQSNLDLELGRSVPIDLTLNFGAGTATLELGGLRLRKGVLATGASDTKLNFSEPNLEILERLELKVGAASFEARGLGNARARVVDFSGGIGDMTLAFDGEWETDTRAIISVGVGSITLILPRDIGVAIKRETFLVSFDADGLIKRGDGYYSAGWDEAEHRLTIELKGALGSINVRWAGESATRTD